MNRTVKREININQELILEIKFTHSHALIQSRDIYWGPVGASYCSVWMLWVPRYMRHGPVSVRSHSLVRQAVSWEKCDGCMNYRVWWKPWKLSGGIVWAGCVLRDQSEWFRTREIVSEIRQGRTGLLTMCRGPRIKKIWSLGGM